MAINIKELNIKLHVGSNETPSSTRHKGTNQPEVSEELLLKKTVKEVLRVLKEQKER